MSIFQISPAYNLSTQIPSDRSQYELYEFWFNKINHIHTYGASKVDLFFCHFSEFSKMAGTIFQLGISTFLCTRSPNPCTNLVQTILLWYGWARNHFKVDHTSIFYIYKVLRFFWCNGWSCGCILLHQRHEGGLSWLNLSNHWIQAILVWHG